MEADNGPQAVRFRAAAELTPQAVAAITDQVRIRVLRWFARSGLIERDDVREMLAWDNSGFSLDAAVRVGAQDRAGLERLLCYCARLSFFFEPTWALKVAWISYPWISYPLSVKATMLVGADPPAAFRVTLLSLWF